MDQGARENDNFHACPDPEKGSLEKMLLGLYQMRLLPPQRRDFVCVGGGG